MYYKELNAAGTYLIKGAQGYLQGITVNLPGSGTLQIADNSAGSAAAPFIAGATAFAIPPAGSYLDYDCSFSNGLTIVVGGTGPLSITVEWS
jgi:hypothetical protein